MLNKFRERFDVADSTIDCVQYYLKKCYAKLPARKQTALWEHLVYIRNNKERLRYVELRLRGLPVQFRQPYDEEIKIGILVRLDPTV